MSKNYKPLDDWSGFWKNSKHLVVFNINNKIDAPKKTYSYISVDEMKKLDNISSSYKSTNIVSYFEEDYFNLFGFEMKKLRNCVNHFNSSIEFRDSISSIDELKSLISIWNEQRGEIYGWQRHSGYDINFFEKYYPIEKDNLISVFAYFENKLVGYGIITKASESKYIYVLGKNDVSFKSLAYYIDFSIMKKIFSEIGQPFEMHWGCSSKGLLQYKRKFPVLREDKVCFCTTKEETKDENHVS